MSTQEKQNENLLVKLIKKSVGLPTAGSSCCGTSAPAENVQPPAAREESSGCGCGKAEAACGCEQEKQGEQNE